jgi:hypothetical protein
MSYKYIILEGFGFIVEHDYDDTEKTLVINTVSLEGVQIIDILCERIRQTIWQEIFDSYDKELQEPEPD